MMEGRVGPRAYPTLGCLFALLPLVAVFAAFRALRASAVP